MRRTVVLAIAVAALTVPQVADAHTLSLRTARTATNYVSQAVSDGMIQDGYDSGWSKASDCYRQSRHKVTCDGHVSAGQYDDYLMQEVSVDCDFPVTTRFVSSHSRRVRVSANADAMRCYDQDGNLVTKRAAKVALKRAVG
jgi:hypothetical protein